MTGEKSPSRDVACVLEAALIRVANADSYVVQKCNDAALDLFRLQRPSAQFLVGRASSRAGSAILSILSKNLYVLCGSACHVSRGGEIPEIEKRTQLSSQVTVVQKETKKIL
jgi:hypothetical protein